MARRYANDFLDDPRLESEIEEEVYNVFGTVINAHFLRKAIRKFSGHEVMYLPLDDLLLYIGSHNTLWERTISRWRLREGR
jgi:hypothetical protein